MQSCFPEKAAYSEYRQARDEMKKLHVYRANAEKSLGQGACAAGKEKSLGNVELILLHKHPKDAPLHGMCAIRGLEALPSTSQ